MSNIKRVDVLYIFSSPDNDFLNRFFQLINRTALECRNRIVREYTVPWGIPISILVGISFIGSSLRVFQGTSPRSFPFVLQSLTVLEG